MFTSSGSLTRNGTITRTEDKTAAALKDILLAKPNGLRAVMQEVLEENGRGPGRQRVGRRQSGSAIPLIKESDGGRRIIWTYDFEMPAPRAMSNPERKRTIKVPRSNRD